MKRNSLLKTLSAGTIGLTGIQNLAAKLLLDNSITQKKLIHLN